MKKKYIISERPNLFEPNVYISMVVKIEGNISPEMVRNAVESAYSANETTMSKIILEENGNAYYKKTETSGCKVIFENRDWIAIIKDSEKQAFAINDGELVRTYIISENQRITLLIHAHHLVGDGKSILILINDILNSLAGKSLTYKPMVLIDYEYLTKRARLLMGVKLLLKKANRKWSKTGKAFTWDDYYAVHKNYWNNHSSDINIETYSASDLKNNCKNGVTLNSLLIAKLLKESPESKVVGIPLSIREDNKSMSNQTSGIAFKYQYNLNKSFEENLTRVHKKIYKQLRDINKKYFVLLFIAELCPSLLDSVLLQTHGCYENSLSEKMADIMGYMGNGGRDLGVTNLTKIDIPNNFDSFKIRDILFIPPKISYSKNVIGISTYEDKLSISYHKMSKE